MKKILFTTAIISLLFAGCDKDKEDPNDPSTEAVKKLPSKIGSTDYQYDDFNRLVKIGDLEITYNANHNPVRFNNGSASADIKYIDNSVIFSSDYYWLFSNDSLTLDANGQLVRRLREIYGSGYEIWDFTYNSNGNITEITRTYYRNNLTGYDEIVYTYTYTYSNIKSIWRHVNTPDWFFAYLAGELYFPLKKGYMPLQTQYTGFSTTMRKHAYLQDSDGYVIQWDMERTENGNETTEVYTIEYVPAK
ncbi:MAG: hypothetical protein FWG79_02060 [Bacteroidales bacterium]|nr:hypothetical protein [Bacteroidales bacterium]